MSIRYTVDTVDIDSPDYELGDAAIAVSFDSANGSLVIRKSYHEVSIPFEMIEVFNTIYTLVYQEFCDSKEQVLKARRAALQGDL